MDKLFKRLGLKFNPFEPSASGAPISHDLVIPESWRNDIETIIKTIQRGRGVKAVVIQGEYGSGKTYLLKWLQNELFPQLRVRSFYFDNPGVHFYDLANSLLKQVGRINFSKTLWEFLAPNIPSYHGGLFTSDFMSWLDYIKPRNRAAIATDELKVQILKTKITDDEEISYKLARIITETKDKSYFEYRDFLSSRKDSLVAEREEAPYLKAIIRSLRLASGSDVIAFLIDEFEEIAIQKRLTRREAQEYLATTKRLLNLAKDENFWVVVAMTPQGAEVTQQLEPALWERFTSHGKYAFIIPQLQPHEVKDLIQYRLEKDRIDRFTPPNFIFPFPENLDSLLKPSTYSSPRKLIKVAFFAIAESVQQKDIKLPFSSEFIKKIESQVYPNETMVT